jgi:hypothetical protein
MWRSQARFLRDVRRHPGGVQRAARDPAGGTLHTKLEMQPAETVIATTVGIRGNFEAVVARDVAIGLNPGVIIGLRGEQADSSSVLARA